MRVPLLLLLSLLAISLAPAREIASETGAPGPLDAALRKLLADEGYWAYTRTIRVFDKDNRLERTDVERYDPSQPDSGRWLLLLRNGRPPSEAEVRGWERQRRREMRRRGKPLGAILDFPAATLADDNRTHLIYSVPIQAGASRRLPAEKFFVLLQVHKERGEIDRLALRTTESFRVAGVARVDNVEADATFGVIAPEHPAQPVAATAFGEARVAWFFRVGGRAELAWSDFARVTPYDARFEVTIGDLKALDF
jgi:hypothetical protein